ncbi:hypothetical protein [Aquimarina pacifica]|uniref:hypothetical protein n=1 Tax=Aquimarina pacifica TaxID=1296415 RepID=UPI0004AD28EF|nr:hypothetical protein [Aquimarina pacifica]
MVTFLSILAGLVAFNFILLKFSTQSVDTDRKKIQSKKSKINSISNSGANASDISNAA